MHLFTRSRDKFVCLKSGRALRGMSAGPLSDDAVHSLELGRRLVIRNELICVADHPVHSASFFALDDRRQVHQNSRSNVAGVLAD
jgi:hypothetical protein